MTNENASTSGTRSLSITRKLIVPLGMLIVLGLALGGALTTARNTDRDVAALAPVATTPLFSVPALDPVRAESALQDQAKPAQPATKSTASPSPEEFSLSLNGEDAYVRVPNNPTLDINGPFTAEAWIKTNSSDEQGIVERYNWLTKLDGGFALRLVKGQAQLLTVQTSNKNDSVTGSTILSDGEWHHVAGVFDGLELRIYVDGVLDGSKASDLTPAAGTTDLVIGAMALGGGFFNGLIDEVNVTSGIRYAANFSPGSRSVVRGFVLNADERGTRGIWRFDDSTLADYSGHKNDGTLVGGATFIHDDTAREPVLSVNAPELLAGTPVFINFDDVPANVDVGHRYNNVVFSSPGLTAFTYFHPTGATPRSFPNILSRGIFSFAGIDWRHKAELFVDFPKPVDDLVFYVTSCDDLFFPIALLDYTENGVLKHSNISGCVPGHLPIVVDFKAAGIRKVSRVRIFNITDTLGVGLDDISYTVPTPTPTPTPTVTPTPLPTPTPTPLPPANVTATPDEAEIFVSWTPSSGANSYVINRTQRAASSNAPALEGGPLVPINPTFVCNSTPCVFRDLDVTSEFSYTYTIQATNLGGTGLNSNSASATPLPQPGCEASPTPAPPPGSVNRHGWTMNYAFSEDDGLVVSNVRLNGKLMANSMSVPYFKVSISPSGVPLRGELTPSSTTSFMRSRLTGFKIVPADPHKVLIQADYAIDKILNAPKACLNITQKYEFYREGASPADRAGPCEPSDTVSRCHKFRPLVEYTFHSQGGAILSSINIPIRLHLQNTVSNGNTVALTRDFDNPLDMQSFSRPFKTALNPVRNSWHSQVIVQRSVNATKDANTVDNFHQTNDKVSVMLPGLEGFVLVPGDTIPTPIVALAGCPECVHLHWRWSTVFWTKDFGFGYPLIPPGSDQAVDIMIVPNKGRSIDVDPIDYYHDLYRPNDFVRNPSRFVQQPFDVVFWYSATGNQNSDRFFWHTAWFTPLRTDIPNLVQLQSSVESPSLPSQDGPVSVNFGGIYEPGTTTFTPLDFNSLPPLPAGYSALNNTGHWISTTAVVAGPHVFNFAVPSVTNQTDFNNLKIFYAQQDPFDPDKAIWVDTTIRPPDTPAPNFSAKTLSARSDRLGLFAIARLVQTPPDPGTANLRVSSTDSADPVTAGDNLTYNITLTNDGPQTANEVVLKDELSPDVVLVSATPSQGTCKTLQGVVYCSLNGLVPGASATLSLVVKPTEGTGNFPVEGKMIANTVLVRSRENDGNPDNDWVTEETRVMPSQNRAPSINITSPAPRAMFIGPLNVTINATATDTDGAISKVEFFDNSELIGTATPGPGNNFSLQATLSPCNPNAHGPNEAVLQPNHPDHHDEHPCGLHSLLAVATDNGGRQNVSSTVEVVVNGVALVNITSPASGALVSPGSTITLSASATHPAALISKVDFLANGTLIGEGVPVGGNQYRFVWNNVPAGDYSIIAIATDNSEITTWSVPIDITVGTPPSVTITSPVEGTTLSQTTNISITATAQSSVGSIVSVDFLANGVLIGSASDVGTDNYRVTWRQPGDGVYSLTAVATDTLGLRSTSPPVNVGINVETPEPGDFIWFDDALPLGAGQFGLNDSWFWVDANPGAFSGSKSHQSTTANGLHQHGFEFATFKLPVNANDKLYTYVFLSPGFKPQEIMLAWKDENSFEHRAYWTDRTDTNWINLGVDGTASRRRMGALPPEGRWVRLEVPAADVGLSGQLLSGMSFLTFGGRATFDRTGKTNRPTPTSPPPGDTVWFDDALPSGATTGGTNNDVFSLTTTNPFPFSGSKAHQNVQGNQNDSTKFRAHFFTGATQPLRIDPGDLLFTYVFLDPVLTPDEIILQWHDGTSWNHRAFWGSSYVFFNRLGNEGMRYMGDLPPAGQWVRLEVPASYVGLEGKKVSGMYFGMNRQGARGLATWDLSGKSNLPPTTTIEPLFATTPIHQYFHNTEGFYYFLSDKHGLGLHTRNKWFVHSNQAAGTVPMFRMRNVTSHRYLFTTITANPGPEWVIDADPAVGDNGIAYYIYPTAGTPETVALHLFRGTLDYYFTVDRQDSLAISSGMAYQGEVGYVHATRSIISPLPNPIDDPRFFVKQHYRDFLSREADTAGENFWVNDYNSSCIATDLPCVDHKRTNISAAFFLSIEFQETGYWVYKFYKSSYNRQPRRQELYEDKDRVSLGVVVGATGWEQTLATNKANFAIEWVTRSSFMAAFPNSLTAAQLVDQLNANAGGALSAVERDNLIAILGATPADVGKRAQVVRAIVEDATLHQAEFNKAFVLMEYFGYLQRNPDDSPDNNFEGYNFWLNKLNQFNGNFVAAEMVKSFLVSTEYRARFGQPSVPNGAANLTVGTNVSAKVANLTGSFNTVTSAGTMNVSAVYPWTVDQPPAGYTFFKNLAWKVTTSSSTSPPYILTASIPWEVDNPAEFANLRIFNREGNAWVDRTILAPDSPAPNYSQRTISARVNSLSTIIIAHQGNEQISFAVTSPANGTVFSAPASINLTTSVFDPESVITRVQFYNGETLIGEDFTAPYGLNWNNVQGGTYTITAKALDTLSVNVASANVNFIVHGPPIVVMVSPESGAVFEMPANIPLTAYASSSAGITKVEFLQGATKLGEDTTAPYTFNWNGVGVGSYSVSAVATTAMNTTATSSVVNLSVINTPPTVSITSPANGTNLGNAPANTVINATANDSHGIKRVEFLRNGVSLGIDTSAPYSFNWNNVATGSFSLTAKATDNLDAVTVSAPVAVTVTNAAPVVSISSPPAGTAFSAPATITINASASDNEGISKVEFFQNAVKVGEDTTAPYSFTWINVASGTYSLTARATDILNATTTSNPVTVTVNPLFTLFADDFNDNSLDLNKWFIVAPGAATTLFERNQRLEITPPTAASVTDYNGIASVSTLDLTNSQVEVEVPQYAIGYGHETYLTLQDSTGHYLLFDAGGGGLLMQDSATGSAGRTVITSYNTTTHRFWRIRHVAPTDTIVWETSADGTSWTIQRTITRPFAITSMQIQLIAGKYAGVEPPLSTAVYDNLRVQSPLSNTAPSVSVTSPANGTVLVSPANITITATAADNDGAITRVEFFRNGTSLGVDTVAPFSYTWSGVAAGSYALTAKATDSRLATTTSETVNVIVNTQPSVALTLPANGATYTAPAVVTVSAAASDSDGTISQIEFFRNGLSLGIDTTSPYSVTWTSVPAGLYSLTAVATDNRGTTATSAAVNIAVNSPPNTPPTVSLTAPAAGAVFTEPATINLTATASDSDGTIIQVEFFQNDVKLGGDTSAPYSFSFTTVPKGTYSLTARATDDRGATTTSSAVNVTVNAQLNPERADTIGVYADDTFYLRNSNTSGPADIVTQYGDPSWRPVVGDWDGNGTTTLGLFMPDAGSLGEPGRSCFALNNSLSGVDKDTLIFFGLTGDLPLAGDWDGDGVVTIGVYRPSDSTFYLRNSNTEGPADFVISLVATGDTPLSGDWNGDGVDTIGIYNTTNRTFYLRNSNASGPPDLAINFGQIGEWPIVGDWDGDGITTIGAYKSKGSRFRLRNSNTPGPEDLIISLDTIGLPVIGNWDGTRPTPNGDVVWFDDNLPDGAISAVEEMPWLWLDAAPVPFSGPGALQSYNGKFEQSFSFFGATQTLPVAHGDKLVVYVFIDEDFPPAEIMLQWNDGTWEHRAYWGENIIDLGVDGTDSRRFMGRVPASGEWVRLEVPASLVGLEGRTLTGMAFNLSTGRATWDRAGKRTGP